MSFGEYISMERPHQKKGRPECGIYLVAPKKIYPNVFAEQLKRACNALNNSVYEKHMHALEMRFPKAVYEKERQLASTLVDICKRNGVVPIIRGDLGLCVEANAEGVIFDSITELEQARQVLGERAIIGLDCQNNQEQAQAALAQGIADYVSFGQFFPHARSKSKAELGLLEWWSTQTHLPAVAHGKTEPNQIISMVKAGAGFIAAGDWVWDHKEGPGRAVYWLAESIEHGLAQRGNMN